MTDALDLYTVETGALLLAVHVQPRAGRSAVVGRHGHALKVVVAAPPLDDRANEATAAVLAEELDQVYAVHVEPVGLGCELAGLGALVPAVRQAVADRHRPATGEVVGGRSSSAFAAAS